MKVAIIGSRNMTVRDLGAYLPDGVTEIVSGGAKGIDTCAADYAAAHGIKLTVFLPDYEHYGKAAPIKRNQQIVDHADIVIAFWDGESKGTKNVIETCKKQNKKVTVHMIETVT